MLLGRCYRGKLPVWAALCVLVLCWFYIFPGYRVPSDKEMVEEVLRQGGAWQRNRTSMDLYRFVSGSDLSGAQCPEAGRVRPQLCTNFR